MRFRAARPFLAKGPEPHSSQPLLSLSKLDYFALFSQSMILGRERESMPNKTNQALTVRDVAAYLNVDEKTIYRLAQRGELPGFKVAGAWRFQSVDLQGWITQRKRLSAKQKGKDARTKR